MCFGDAFSQSSGEYFGQVSETFGTDPLIALFYFLLAPLLVPISALSLFLSGTSGGC